MTEQRINPFVLPAKEYHRDLDVLQHYLTHSATYLAKMTGKTYDECLDYVRNTLKPEGRFAFKDPKITYLERKDNGDRELKEGTLYWYLNISIKEHDIVAPTFTTYYSPHVKRSLLAGYIDLNGKKRDKAKKEMFAAEMAKDLILHAFKKGEQTNAKQRNNSLSGAHNSSSTPLHNKTAHSTLTSVCRSTSGYGSANNEKFLAGNRHYWSPMIVTNNIISIIKHTDYAELSAVIKKYAIKLPSVEETMACIHRSTKLYWTNERSTHSIHQLIERLSGIERAAFVYTGDLYHLREFNPELIRTFLTQLAKRIDTPCENAGVVIKNALEDQLNLATQICTNVTKGKTLKNLEGTQGQGIVAATVKNIYDTIVDYADFIKTFFVTDNLPASMGYFPDSIRHVVLMSDTDSTIFTVQDWVEWHHGKIGFTDECNAISASMIFLASASITHVLAKMSANLGAETDLMFHIAMKNEFKFDIFTPTQVAKHYFAYISSQEGNVFDKYKEEIKGVHLKNSNVSKYVMKKAKEMMIGSMSTIINGGMVDLKGYLKEIADIERSIVSSIESGSHDFFKYGRLNSKDSYKQEEDRSNYRHYLLWDEVFAPDYGTIAPPPYTCLKLSTDLDTPSKTKDWLFSLENRALAQRMEDWLKKYNKKYIGMVMLPEPIVSNSGIPKELLQAVDIRNMILDSTNVFYILAECFGIYMLNKKKTKLFLDYY